MLYKFEKIFEIKKQNYGIIFQIKNQFLIKQGNNASYCCNKEKEEFKGI